MVESKIKVSRFLKHVQGSGGIVNAIAEKLGVTRMALYNWLNRNPAYWEYVYDEREGLVDIAENQLRKKTIEGADWAIKFVLGASNRGRRRGYNEGPNVVVNNETNTGPKYIIEIVQPQKKDIKTIIAKYDDEPSKMQQMSRDEDGK